MAAVAKAGGSQGLAYVGESLDLGRRAAIRAKRLQIRGGMKAERRTVEGSHGCGGQGRRSE